MYITVGKIIAVLIFIVLIAIPFRERGRALLSDFFGDTLLGQFFYDFETKENIKDRLRGESVLLISFVMVIVSLIYLVFTIIVSLITIVIYPLVMLILLVSWVISKKLK